MNPRLQPSPTTQQAIALYESGRLQQAEHLLTPYLQRERRDPFALALMAQIHFDRGRLPQSEFAAKQAVALLPNFPAPLIVLARVLWAQNRPAEAMPFVTRAAEADPNAFQGWAARGHIAASMKDYDTAIASYERSLSINRDQNEAAIMGLAQTLGHLGQRARAVAVLREGCAAQPTNPRMAAELASTLNYVSGVSAREIAAAHFEIGRRLDLHPRPRLPAPAFSADPGKCLRVGLISGDLRLHPVAFFMEPILAHRDPAAVEYVAFSTRVEDGGDAWTARLRAHCTDWCSLIGTDENESGPLILGKSVDVLIDLAGHTNASGVWLFRNRLAPVQMTYLGYPNTTGLRTIDYRLVSTMTDPPGSEPLCAERLLRLDPCMHAYVPPPEAPPVRDPAARAAGPIRFGSFNNVGKISAHTLDLWARVLAAVPASTLVLKSETLGDAPSWRSILDELRARGAEISRVHALPRAASFAEHLGQYHDIDIAFDTTPYNGTTTTCEALWMGVPVVGLWGDRHAARVGGALLCAAGVPELVADGDDGYVALAAALAADEARRQHYRRTLRSTLAAGVLCDGPAMARRFETALRTAWHERCAKASQADTPCVPTSPSFML